MMIDALKINLSFVELYNANLRIHIIRNNNLKELATRRNIGAKMFRCY